SPSAPPASSPAPRLRARSTLSAGTEFFLAFWMASYSVGFPAGSPPPVRAATSTFLTSLAKSLPRLASMTAFLCLVVAHLEWPAMRVLSQCRRRGEEYAHRRFGTARAALPGRPVPRRRSYRPAGRSLMACAQWRSWGGIGYRPVPGLAEMTTGHQPRPA